MSDKKQLVIHREDWWATPIWFFNIDDDNIDFNQAIQECYKEKTIDKEGRQLSNINGWQSNFISANKYCEIQKVIDLINKSSITYKNIIGIHDNLNLYANNYWININNKDGYNMAHIHPSSILSCVIYLKAPENCGDIIFFRNSTEQFALANYTKNNNSYNFETIKYKPSEKKVIIFPSYILHTVEQNKSNEDRISISFNFELK